MLPFLRSGHYVSVETVSQEVANDQTGTCAHLLSNICLLMFVMHCRKCTPVMFTHSDLEDL